MLTDRTQNRFSVAACKHTPGASRSYGYTLVDAQPRWQFSDDVEGYGLHTYPQPKRLTACMGWYKLNKDAQARADVMNAAWKEGRLANNRQPNEPINIAAAFP